MRVPTFESSFTGADLRSGVIISDSRKFIMSCSLSDRPVGVDRDGDGEAARARDNFPLVLLRGDGVSMILLSPKRERMEYPSCPRESTVAIPLYTSSSAVAVTALCVS